MLVIVLEHFTGAYFCRKIKIIGLKPFEKFYIDIITTKLNFIWGKCSETAVYIPFFIEVHGTFKIEMYLFVHLMT